MADVDGANVVVADAGAEATGGLGPQRALARCSFLTQESLVLDWLLAALTAAEAEASPRFTAIEHVTCDEVDVRAFGQMGLVHGVAHSGEGSLSSTRCNVHVDAVHRLSGQSPSLPCELRSSADPARLGRPRSLCFPFLDRRVEQVAHHLPPAGGSPSSSHSTTPASEPETGGILCRRLALEV
jgi:hypothetical protein